MSFNQRQVRNLRPQTIKTRALAVVGVAGRVSQGKSKRRTSEGQSGGKKEDYDTCSKRIIVDETKDREDLNDLVVKTQQKNEKLRNQLFESLSKFKAANSEYINVNENIVQEIGNIQTDLNLLKEEFDSIDDRFLSQTKIKSLLGSPLTAASRKDNLNKKTPNQKIIQTLRSLQEDVLTLKNRLDSTEREYGKFSSQSSFEYFRNLMTTAETLVDNSEKNVQCKSCYIF